jgi:hypothetical protein
MKKLKIRRAEIEDGARSRDDQQHKKVFMAV